MSKYIEYGKAYWIWCDQHVRTINELSIKFLDFIS